jgi:hypothetical protein
MIYNQKLFDINKVCEKCMSSNVIWMHYSGAYKVACDCTKNDIKPIHKEVNQSYSELMKDRK